MLHLKPNVIIPSGKFSIRIVPDQTPDYVESVVKKYLEKQWAKRGSTNTCNVSMGHGGKCWVSDINHPNYRAGKAATKMVYGVDPDLTREGKGTYAIHVSVTIWLH